MRLSSVVLTSIFALSVLWAADARAQATTCESVEYSQAVLDKAPDIKQLCLRVQDNAGTPVAVVEGTVSRVYRNDAIQIRFKLPDGSKTAPRYIKSAPDRRILIEGKPTRTRDLVVGQKLTFFIDTQVPSIATEPEADAALEFVPIEMDAPEEQPDVAAEAMPKTASPLAALALCGAGFLSLAGGLRWRRRR